MKMLLAGTPTDCTPATISRMISGEEQHAGAPEGLILIPTMSAGPMNLAQAAGSELSLVSSFMPRSIMTLISGCATRLRDRVGIGDLDHASRKQSRHSQ